ncbi:TPA: HNH endonuclease [Candidatus Micrarchaeota archaeon]|nr:HNH endonuclease [Candidatus Micrarchaeota archaeon]
MAKSKNYGLISIVALFLVVVLYAFQSGLIQLPSTTPPAASNSSFGVQTQFSGCVVFNGLPDRACSPGAINASCTVKDICTPGYTKTVRNVSQSVWNKVFEEYGVTEHSGETFEVDHIVSLQLCGSNDISNLYAEPVDPRPCPQGFVRCGFKEKDKVENWLNDQVCNGLMTLTDAQHQIAENWTAVYQRMQQSN